VNAERLHAIVEALKAEIEETQYPSLLDQLVEGLRESAESPNQPGPQEQASSAREKLNAVLREAPSGDFSAAWRQALDEMGVVDLLGDALANEIERILSGNEITPSAAANELEEIRQRVQQFVNSLNQASSALDFFRIGSGDLAPGEFEIGFLIPRNTVDNGLEHLGQEFVELKKIIAPFSELVGEGRPEIHVRSIASSEFQVFLDSTPAVAAVVATAVERLLAAYERILNIRNLHRQLAEEDVPDDALEGVAKHVTEGMEGKIREIAENVVAEAELGDSGRSNELKTEVALALRKLAQRIDHGYDIEVRAGEIPESSEDDVDDTESDQAMREAARVVLDAQPGLEFMNVSGKAILSLEHPGETSGQDGDVEHDT
jgi:hypothetical protein